MRLIGITLYHSFFLKKRPHICFCRQSSSQGLLRYVCSHWRKKQRVDGMLKMRQPPLWCDVVNINCAQMMFQNCHVMSSIIAMTQLCWIAVQCAAPSTQSLPHNQQYINFMLIAYISCSTHKPSDFTNSILKFRNHVNGSQLIWQ